MSAAGWRAAGVVLCFWLWCGLLSFGGAAVAHTTGHQCSIGGTTPPQYTPCGNASACIPIIAASYASNFTVSSSGGVNPNTGTGHGDGSYSFNVYNGDGDLWADRSCTLTLDGNNCSAGYSLVNGVCSPEQTCPPPGTVTAMLFDAYPSNSQGEFCNNGCTLRGSFTVSYGGNTSTGGTFRNTGTACATGNTTPSALKCSVGFVAGTVNGTEVCVPGATTELDPPSTSASAPAGSASAPPGVVPGTTNTSTTCTGNTCVTTITTTTNNVVTSVTNITNTVAGFCAGSPGSVLCEAGGGGGEGDEEESTFGGSCAGGFSCGGDAIQCAIAKDQHLRHCVMFDSTAAEVTAGLALINSPSELLTGDAGTPGNPMEVDVGTAMNAGMVNRYSGACPSDLVYAVSFGSFTIPLSQACPALQLAGQIAVAMTLISAAGWLIMKGGS